jgi:hypothetical protein
MTFCYKIYNLNSFDLWLTGCIIDSILIRLNDACRILIDHQQQPRIHTIIDGFPIPYGQHLR